MEEIDIEEEKIKVGEVWKSAEELREEIKERIGKGDFEITDEALALKKLNKALQNYTEISIKLPAELIDTFKDIAEKNDLKFQDVIRRKLQAGLMDMPASLEEPAQENFDRDNEEDGTEWEENEGEEVTSQEETPVIGVGEALPADTAEQPITDADNVQEPKVTRVRCHKCKKPITITTSARPLTVTCPYCGAQGKLE